MSERITWIEIVGIPLHYWNQETFRRIVELWGSLEVLGENSTQSLDCEKLTILISTKQTHKIDKDEVSQFPSRLSPVKYAYFNASSLEFPRNEESDAPREVEGGDVSGKSKGNSQEKDCCNNETIPILAPFIDTNGSCKIFEGIDEACPFDLKDPCRRNGKSIASVEDRDLTLERNSFELPELHDMYKESQINKNKFTMGDMTCVTFYSSFEGNWRNLLGVSRITVNVDDLEESVEYDDGEF
ncbi:hypothetical protein V6N13_009314 [Hibiscus sabdariffa]